MRATPWATLVSVVLALGLAMTGSPAGAATSAPTGDPSEAGLPPVGPGLQPGEGKVLEPSRGEQGVEQEVQRLEALPETTARPLPSTYRKLSYTPRSVKLGSRPYDDAVVHGWDGPGARDATGVRMVVVKGEQYDHPVAQAQDALRALSDHRLTKEARYLRRAVLDAERLISNRVESDGAWYFPYPFDFALHGNTRQVMKAPWFSAMAQGQALSVFVRLHEVTGEQRWRDAADATFASFGNAPVQGRPSTVHIDSSGYLWLEEYPMWPPASSDRTLNGHVFAIFGLFDYQRLTGSKAALSLWNGGLAMVRKYMGGGYRNPGWISHYCLAHPAVQSESYHQVHQDQLLHLHGATGDSWWSRVADSLRTDFPAPVVSGQVMFAGGSHTVYRFGANGAVTASKTIRLTRSSGAPADRRQRIKGRGVYYRITAGMAKGYWVGESSPKAQLLGLHLRTTYPLSRTATLPKGRWPAYKYSSTGKVTSVRYVSLSRPSNAPFDSSAVINGRPHVRITAGTLAGYWLPSRGVVLN